MAAFGLFYVFMDRDEVRVNKNAKTNDLEWGQYTAISNKQAWSIKNLLYDQEENYFLRLTQEIPNGQRGLDCTLNFLLKYIFFNKHC